MSEADYLAYYAKKAVLITGGLGFIGSNLARRLVDLGAEVTLADSLIPDYGGNLFNVAGYEKRLRVNIADVRDPAHAKVIFSDSQVGLFYGDQLVDRILGGRYLVAYWQRSGPAWYDISGPAPRLTGNTPDTGRYSWTDGVCPFGDKLLLIKRGVYCLLEPNETRTASDLPAYAAPGVRIAGRPTVEGATLALSRRFERTVRVVDISEFAHPKLLREYSLFGHPGACAFWHGKLVIPAGYQGLLVERTAAK